MANQDFVYENLMIIWLHPGYILHTKPGFCPCSELIAKSNSVFVHANKIIIWFHPSDKSNKQTASSNYLFQLKSPIHRDRQCPIKNIKFVEIIKGIHHVQKITRCFFKRCFN